MDNDYFLNRAYGKGTRAKPSSIDLSCDNFNIVLNSDIRAGIEIEVEEYYPISDSIKYWVPKIDDSLRNNGMEFCLRSPLYGTQLVNSIKEINISGLHKSVFNERCANHYHIDMSWASVEELSSIIIWHAIIEKQLFDTLSPNRYGNNFCVPIGQQNNLLYHIGKMISCNSSTLYDNLSKLIGDSSKYNSVNYRSLYDHGSLEFRQFNSTCDSGTIFNELGTLLKFIHAAKDLGRNINSSNISYLFKTIGGSNIKTSLDVKNDLLVFSCNYTPTYSILFPDNAPRRTRQMGSSRKIKLTDVAVTPQVNKRRVGRITNTNRRASRHIRRSVSGPNTSISPGNLEFDDYINVPPQFINTPPPPPPQRMESDILDFEDLQEGDN